MNLSPNASRATREERNPATLLSTPPDAPYPPCPTGLACTGCRYCEADKQAAEASPAGDFPCCENRCRVHDIRDCTICIPVPDCPQPGCTYRASDELDLADHQQLNPGAHTTIDTLSSESRQHYIEAGHYLRKLREDTP